jgi:catechol 2,3-dioxygenase-like lactoylglutathione lyase family enzyme
VIGVEKVDFVSVPTRDRERSRKFYGETLGLEGHGDRWNSGVCHMAVFADPDGNHLILHHRYAPHD